MKLTQVKGNTWVAEGAEFIPFCRLKKNGAVLLDTGLEREGPELERALLDAGLTPAGILGSHAHVDHCGNHRYFQEKYHIPVAMTAPEAGMATANLNLKCYTLVLSPDMARQEMDSMLFRTDLVLPEEDGTVEFCGVPFQILHTPGHSAGHISLITPDNVCYAADTLLSREMLGAKLPYALDHALDLKSKEKLRGLHCDAAVIPHRGICPGAELDALIDANTELILLRAGEIGALIDRPMSFSQINAAVCRYYKLFTHVPRHALRFERNIRFFVEFLLDRGELCMELEDGVVLYRPAEEKTGGKGNFFFAGASNPGKES